jgi:hypothetical protein
VTVQAPATQTPVTDWKPRVNESFETWVERLAAQRKEAIGHGIPTTQ